ncbi:EamA family transporter [Acinetobacter rudis]|uniref:EamA family transporter n=1 Tax=Acinetobacter rudis TaxID=632955 RepID=UPI003340A4A1
MQNSQSTTYIRDILLTALAPMIWGSTYIVASELLPADRPFTAALIRVLPAGLVLLLWARQFPRKQDFWRLTVLAILNISAFQALLFVAAYRLPGGLAAVLGAVQPLILMGLIWAVDSKAPNKMALIAASMGVVGMAVLLLSPETVFEPIGMLAALLGATSMAAGVWLTQRWKIQMSVQALTGWQLLLGGLMLFPIAYVFDPALPELNSQQIMGYVYLCLIGALLAYVLWFRGVARLPAVAVASLGLLSPLTAILLGWLFLSQSITGVALLGLVVVLISVFAVQYSASKA